MIVIAENAPCGAGRRAGPDRQLVMSREARFGRPRTRRDGRGPARDGGARPGFRWRFRAPARRFFRRSGFRPEHASARLAGRGLLLCRYFFGLGLLEGSFSRFLRLFANDFLGHRFPFSRIAESRYRFLWFRADSAMRRQGFIYQSCGSLQQLRARSLAGLWQNNNKILFEKNESMHLALGNRDFAAKTPC
ncbi:hypothetical protein IMX07_07310 [bacterium]|nr:hypothetical protein [bacterium]